MTLLPYTVDPLLPSFPNIGKYFGVGNAAVQMTLAGVTAGFALGQLVAGPLSDALGRRRPLQVAVLLYVAATIASAFAPNIELFFVARLLMGIGSASASVVAAAVIRDLYVGLPMMKMLSRVYLVQGIAPILGPLAGSQLLSIFTWQQILLVIAFYGAVVFVGIRIFLVETLHSDNRRSHGVLGMVQRFRSVLRDRIYLGLVVFSVSQTVALFAYLNTVSFLFQNSFGLSANQFGIFFAINSLASAIGLQFAALVARRLPAQWVLFGHICLAVLTGLGLVVAGVTHAPFGVVTTLTAVFLFNFGATFTPMQSIALAPHGEEAGTAASLMGVLNFAVTALVTPLFAFISQTDSSGIGFVIAGTYGIGLLSMIFIVRPRTVPALAA